ncbi:MAG: DUF2064 domain-containing protein [Chitinophagaceae bacterium]
MHINTNDTAVIVFTHSAQKEAETKLFSPQNNFSFNKKVAECLINKTVSLVKKTGLPYFVIDEKMQYGQSFGEKLANAIQDHFLIGYKRLIIIGNDCLGLTTHHLINVYHLLKNNEVVAGPSKKGGLYLIGLNSNSFNKSSFQNIRWQSAQVFFDFLRLTNCLSLSVMGDINNGQELRQQLSILRRDNKFHQILISFLASFTHYYLRTSYILKQSALLLCKGLRAPPSAISFS